MDREEAALWLDQLEQALFDLATGTSKASDSMPTSIAASPPLSLR